MAEERLFIESGGLKIECLMENSPGERAVVITHPHPLYGGDMHNNVVESVAKAYQQEGYATLRINFRGVGQSEGAYGDGIGEQEDVSSALSYLAEQGKSSIDLAGYSFGAWVNAMGLTHLAQVQRVIMVSPPVSFIDFSFLEYNPRIQLVIAGSADDIGPPAMIKGMIATWNPEAQFEIIQGADHFYWGKTGEIKKIIMDFLEPKG